MKSRLDSWLKDKKHIGIAGHVRPDGDSVGSTSALYAYICLYYPYIEVDYYLEEIPDSFNFIKATKEIKHSKVSDETLDLAIALDCGSYDRLGFAGDIFKEAKSLACIDHHISNESFGDVNYIDPKSSSTCELVYDLFAENDLELRPITKEIAESLYMGIVHDTGVFQYPSTSPKTMNIAGKLMGTGIDFYKIINETFYEKTYTQTRLLGYGLETSKLYFDNKVITSVMDRDVFLKYKADKNDVEGVVANILKCKGVEVAIFIYETEEKGEFKVSLRSKKYVDCNKIAGKFGGGGHKAAAGCSMSGTMEQVLDLILNEVKKEL
ncbi:MAG: bifunctional oligoribonuclease/PAP phosphatase NrnA [Lachnospiraceae bacterium]|jgi:phosphoesterase RecJ-like protein|nr:bifunctional oligoribonuclease/PAP phosphatase NrnA [Lachnospiraceae bacterium]